MIKRLTVAVAAPFVLLSPAFGAGTIPFSLSQQLDQYAKPLAGCKFYTIQAGTTSTPQNAYQDSALTLALPNPQICDSAGRLPQMFLADGTVKVRLTDKNGVTQVVADNIQVIGASSGGGGGGTVDPTTILQTGDIKYRYGTGVHTGFVRQNGRTIGSSTSGATERANADTQALFEYLWNTDVNLVVSTGRGASANADWVANKTIALPDARGRVFVGPDGMGNSLAGRIGSGAGSFGVNNDTLGFGGGAEVHTLTLAKLPTGITSRNSSQSISVSTSQPVLVGAGFTSGNNGSGVGINYWTGGASTFQGSVGTNDIQVTSTNTGGAPFDSMSPAIIITPYQKL